MAGRNSIHRFCTFMAGCYLTSVGACFCLLPSPVLSLWSSSSLRDLLQWPVALPNDGLTDVAIQEPASVSSFLRLMSISPYGGTYWSKTVRDVPRESNRPTLANLSRVLSFPHPPHPPTYSNTTSKPTRTVSRPTTLVFSQSTVKIPPVPISKWKFIRGWVLS